MQNLLHNLRYAGKQWKKSPAFAFTVILTIALGIGPNTAIFSTLCGQIWGPRESPVADRTVVLWSRRGHEQGWGDRGQINVSVHDYREWQLRSRSFEGLGAVTQTDVTLDDLHENPKRITVQFYTPGLITLLGTPLLMGRDFLPVEGTPGNNHVVIIGHRLWKERYGSDPEILGKQLRLDNQNYTIVGVRVPGESDRRVEQAWPVLALGDRPAGDDIRDLTVLGVLKHGISQQDAQTEMDAISRQLAKDFPLEDKGWTVSLQSAASSWNDQRLLNNLWLLMGAVSFILLIACANVSNLLLARGATREKELATRLTLGATRKQIFEQMLLESALLAALGGLLGAAMSWAILKLYLALLPPHAFSPVVDISLSYRVLLFTAGTTILAALVFGCAPAWRGSRLQLSEALKSGKQSGVRRGQHRLGRLLVCLEVISCLTLLAAAELTLSHLWHQMHRDLGLRTDHILTFDLPQSTQQRLTREQVSAYNRELMDTIRSVPGVQFAAAVEGMPLQALKPMEQVYSVVGDLQPQGSSRPPMLVRFVTPDFFHVFGIQLKEGRFLDTGDRGLQHPVVVVNQSFVKCCMAAGRDPLMRTFLLGEDRPPERTALRAQIVGVYGTFRNAVEMGGEDVPEAVFPLDLIEGDVYTSIAVRALVEPSELEPDVAAAVHRLHPDLPLDKVETMDQVLRERLGFDRFEGILYGSFAALALLLCAFGIYSLMRFVISQRTPEMALRIALGATTASIRYRVMREAWQLLLMALPLGLAAAFAAEYLIQTSLYGAGSLQMNVLVGSTLLLSAVLLLACIGPAQRAAKADPMTVLRAE